MLRITTDNINKNVTNLLPAIHTILARRSRQRG
jgi:very-short-patch-repair endonuclease